AVALGVAVVLAKDLAGEAATRSFHSSLGTLSGRQDFESAAAGGVPEEIVGKLVALPYDWQITPRMEGYALIAESKRALPLLGLDVVAEAGRTFRPETFASSQFSIEDFTNLDSVWVGQSLNKNSGDTLQLLINDRAFAFTVRGTFPDDAGAGSAILMDIAAAQTVL